MLKITLITISLLFFTHTGIAKELNYIQSDLFRLSSMDNEDRWLIPFYRLQRSSFPKLSAKIFALSHPDVKNLIDDIESKNDDIIQNRLNNSFGTPYSAFAKANITLRYKKIVQSLSLNYGASAIVNDPVFPQLEGLLFQDYIYSLSYIYKATRELLLIPKIILGRRRVLDSSFSVGDLVQKKQDTKIKNRAWNKFSEFSLSSRYRINHFDFLLEFNSLPLSSNDYTYWNSNIGIRLNNLSRFFNSTVINNLDSYIIYSPLYGGNYDVLRTIKLGAGIQLYKIFNLDIFLEDELSLGSSMKLNMKYFSISLYTANKSYDDFGKQKERIYGLSFNAKY